MDRITEIRIENVRAIESVRMRMGRSVTVLIGENGTCKSTVLECLEILRRAAHPAFVSDLYRVHGGLPSLLRRGASELTLGVTVEDDAGAAPAIRYAFTLAPERSGAAIRAEWLSLSFDPSTADPPSRRLAELERRRNDAYHGPNGRPTERFDPESIVAHERVKEVIASLDRDIEELQAKGVVPHTGEPLEVVSSSPGGARVYDPGSRSPKGHPADSGQLILPNLEGASAPPGVARLLRVLRGIEVQVGFDTVPSWVARSLQRPVTLRGASVLFPATRLDLLGGNLASAWSELKNRGKAHVEESMELVRLGLGDHVDSVVVPADRGGGNVYLGVLFRGMSEPVFASELSDGQLAWLAFVAMARLADERSLLAVDEPELHLHPALLGRVVSLLSNLPGGVPAILSTHSDRVLELLEDPVDAVRVCQRRGSAATVAELDAEQLERWSAEYGDLGQLRAAGSLNRVVSETAHTGAKG